MLKSQIKKANTTAYLKGTPHKCYSFPNTPEGIELIKAYLLTQFHHPYGMVLNLDVAVTKLNQRSSNSGPSWDVTYQIQNGIFTSISERIFRLFGTDTHIYVPRKFPRLTRSYVLKDIRDDGLTLHSPLADWSLDFISQDEVDAFATEEKSRPTRIYGEPAGHAELYGAKWAEDMMNLDQPDPEKRKALLADIMGDPKPGMKVVDKDGWKGVYGCDPSFPDSSEPVPVGLPDAVVSPKYKEAFEEEVKKLKEKYPDVPEEEFRRQLGNMIKE